MAQSKVHPAHRFEPWQIWPGSFGNSPTDGNYPVPENIPPVVTRATPIASIGSCFAREIKRRLLNNGFNYITEETHNPASIHASAAWERIYNTFSMRQVFEYTFESFDPQIRWWKSPDTGRIQDPYRRIILYDSLEKARKDFDLHIMYSRRVLSSARLLIITLGLTEIWEDKLDGSVICLPSGPYVNEGGDMSRYRFRVSRYTENLENMERIHEIMSEHNPDCKLLVTISPVHLWATFRYDEDVITASCNSKSTLRAVADEFTANHNNVFYFPAFEMATIYRPFIGESIFADGNENFHINKPTIKFIMNQFFKTYTSA
jgi:hypothetical protein